MRRERGPTHPGRLAAVAAVIGLVGAGCAALSGLDSLSEEACAPDCDGGAGLADGGRQGDSTVNSGEDSSVVPPTDGQSSDTGRDAGGGGTDSGAGTDALFDSGAAADSGLASDSSTQLDSSSHDTGAHDSGSVGADTGPDTGCGPLDSIDNCGACGAACVPTTAKDPECNGVTCSYTCATNGLDCNQSVPPDLDGCECFAPGATQSQCCATGCPQSHSYDTDITTASFYDCVTAGTFNITVAKDACGVYAGDSGLCDLDYTFTCTGPDGGVISDMVCSNAYTGSCACWAYDGTQKGHMHIGTASGTASLSNCLCPSTVDPSWN